MGILSNQAIKSSIYIYIGVIVGFVSSGILLPKLMSTEDIGLIRIITSYSALFGQLASLGFVPATTKLFPKFRNKENGHNGFLVLSTLVSLIGLLVLALAFFLFKDLIIEKTKTSSIELSRYINFILVIGGFTALFLILDAYTRALFFTSTGIFVKEFLQKLLNLIAIALYGFKVLDFTGYMAAFVLINSVPVVFILVFLAYKKELAFKPNPLFWNKALIKNLANVSLFGIISSFTGILVINIDSIMISTLMGLDAAGIYATIFYFAFVINIPYRAMERVSAALISEFWEKNNLEGIAQIYKKSATNQSVIALLIFLLIWVNEHNVFIFLPAEYQAGRIVLLILGLGFLINMASGVNNSVIGTSDSYRFQTYLQIFLVLMLVVSNLLCIPKWGINGAALASAISMFILNLVKYLFIKIKFRMDPLSKSLFGIMATGLLVIGINFLLPQLENIYIDAMYRTGILGSIYIFTIYIFKISPDINRVITNYLQLLKLKK